MPHWLWAIHPNMLTWKDKHFLSYLWWCGNHGAHSWNYRLAKMFKCSERTIRRRLQKFKKLHLIHIGHPQDRGRTIWANPYYSHEVWLQKATEAQRPQRRTKLATINNAQQNNKLKSAYYSAGAQKGAPDDVGGTIFTSSNAAGAGGSKRLEKIRPLGPEDDPQLLKEVLEEQAAIMLEFMQARMRRKQERG